MLSGRFYTPESAEDAPALIETEPGGKIAEHGPAVESSPKGARLRLLDAMEVSAQAIRQGQPVTLQAPRARRRDAAGDAAGVYALG